MKLRQKMVAVTMGGALLSVLLGTLLVYTFIKNTLIENESTKLTSVTGHFVSSASKRFLESNDKLTSFARLLTIELEKPSSKEDLNSFYRLMEKNADGVWRNKKSLFNGQVESGVFLPSHPHENETQKIQHARIKRIMDTFGASSDKLFENIWYLSLDRSEIIFDKNLPNFVFEQSANNDYTQTPWVTYTSPELNPHREVRFTPPLYDPVPKIWMVSAIYPIYQNEKWIGSIGEDLRITDVLAFMFESEQMYQGTEHFLIDDQGNYVLAGSWQAKLESIAGSTKFNIEGENQLNKLFESNILATPTLLTTNLMLHNKRYVAIGMLIDPLGWRYFKVIPVDEMLKSTQALFLNLLMMILAIIVLNGIFTFTIAGKLITNRINLLGHHIKNFGKKRQRIALLLSGNDEIKELAQAFDLMTQDLTLRESELKLSRDQYLSLVNNIPGISFRCSLEEDLNTQILFINGLVEKITGYHVDELMANSDLFSTLIYPDDIEGKREAIEQSRKNSTNQYNIDYRIVCLDTEIRWVSESGRVYFDDFTHGYLIDGFIVDITDKKYLDAERERLLKILNEASDFIGMADMQANITYLNPAAKRMVGLAEDVDISQLKIHDMHTKEAVNLVLNEALPYVLDNELWLSENTLLHKLGYEIPVSQSVHLHRDKDGNPAFLSTIMRDITELKIAEKAMFEAKESAEALAQSKTDFLANMSHEIRTPMNAILGLSELALHSKENNQNDYLEKIHGASENLLKILNDILEFSKLDSARGEITSDNFNLGTLVNNLNNLFEVIARQKNIRFDLEVSPDVERHLIGDELRLQQVLTNLLNNSIKFTQTGFVSLSVTCSQQDDKHVLLTFSIKDSGIGISPEQQKSLFQPFTQADSSITRRFGGTGLGLVISQKFIHLMGGEIALESTLNEGSHFWFTLPFDVSKQSHSTEFLPVKQNKRTTAEELEEAAKLLVNKRVLLVEDTPLNQQVASEFLRNAKLRVVVADNGKEALEILEFSSFDIVLMDIQMPVMDGLEATRLIREQPQFATLPIIAMSAGVTFEEQEKCNIVGMTDFISKPINPLQMLNKIKQYLIL